MIKGSNFIIGHILISDLPALVPLLNDPDIRGEKWDGEHAVTSPSVQKCHA